MRRDEDIAPNQEKENKIKETVVQDFVINTKIVRTPTVVPTRVKSCPSAIADKRLIARDEKEEVQAKREYYENSSAGNTREDAMIMSVCHSLVTRGLPSLFIVFSLVYMGFGMSYYS